MSQRFRIISLLISIVLGFVYLGVAPNYFHEAKDFSLESREFEYLKEKADKGSRMACKDVGVIYDYYKKYAEAVKYWECSINKKAVQTSLGTRHLAGYYFHGYGVDSDPAKGAMYVILGDNRVWPRAKKGKRRLFSAKIRHADISYIDDIEGKFEDGARLAKEYIKDKNITDPRLTEYKLDERLKWHLGKLRTVDSRILFYKIMCILALIVLLIAVVIELIFKNRAKKL